MSGADAILTEAFMNASRAAGLKEEEETAYLLWLGDEHWKNGLSRFEWERQMENASEVVKAFRKSR